MTYQTNVVYLSGALKQLTLFDVYLSRQPFSHCNRIFFYPMVF